jgi:hypothetical protein
MKIRLLLALVGLAVSFAFPTLAQQKDTVDPQTIEQLNANIKKADEAFNSNDAAAVAALVTEGAAASEAVVLARQFPRKIVLEGLESAMAAP